jgi:DNA-directed RNA polymerase subunit RPC12/RpoP
MAKGMMITYECDRCGKEGRSEEETSSQKEDIEKIIAQS